jgi:uncharacterized membrane protein YhaH (DUF805 family)
MKDQGLVGEMAEGNMASREITFSGAIASAFSRCFDYKGRSTRAEYWWYWLFTFLVSAVLTSVVNNSRSPSSFTLFFVMLFALIVPNISLIVRRAHDININAWVPILILSAIIGFIGVPWAISQEIATSNISSIFWISLFFLYISLSLVFFIISFIPGTKGENRFGPDPLTVEGSTPPPSSDRHAEVYRQQVGQLDAAPGEKAAQRRVATEPETSLVAVAAPSASPQTRPATQAPAVTRAAPPRLSQVEGGQSLAPEEDPYDIAGRELQSGAKHAGTWARAMVEADGDPARTEAAYVRLRVNALEAIAETGRAEAAAEAEALRLRIEADVEAKARAEARSAEVRAEEMAHAKIAEARARAEEAARMVEAEAAWAKLKAEMGASGVIIDEARLRVLAREAIQADKDAKLGHLPAVIALAKYIMVAPEEAADLALWSIAKESGGGYRYKGKHYALLHGALAVARSGGERAAAEPMRPPVKVAGQRIDTNAETKSVSERARPKTAAELKADALGAEIEAARTRLNTTKK